MCAYRKRRSGEDSDPEYVPDPAAKKAKTTPKVTSAKQSSAPKLLLARPYTPKVTNGVSNGASAAPKPFKPGTSAQKAQNAVTSPLTPNQASGVNGALVDSITAHTNLTRPKDGSAGRLKSSALSKNGRVTVLQAPTTPTRGSSLAFRFNKNARPDLSKSKVHPVKEASVDTPTPTPTPVPMHKGPTTPSISESGSSSSPPETPTKQPAIAHNGNKNKIIVSASAMPSVLNSTVSIPDHVFNSLEKHAGKLAVHNIASWHYLEGTQRGIGFGVRAVKELLMDELKRFGTMLGEPIPLGKGFTDRFQQADHIDHPNSPFDRIAAKNAAEQFLDFEAFFKTYHCPELDAPSCATDGSGSTAGALEIPLLEGPCESRSGSGQHTNNLPDTAKDLAATSAAQASSSSTTEYCGMNADPFQLEGAVSATHTDSVTMNNMQRSTSAIESTGISGTAALQVEGLFRISNTNPTVGSMQRSDTSASQTPGATSTNTGVVQSDHALPVPDVPLAGIHGTQTVNSSSGGSVSTNSAEHHGPLPDPNYALMHGLQIMDHLAMTQLSDPAGPRVNMTQQNITLHGQENSITPKDLRPVMNVAGSRRTAGTGANMSHPFTQQQFAVNGATVDHRDRRLDSIATTEGAQESMPTPSLVETEAGRAFIKV